MQQSLSQAQELHHQILHHFGAHSAGSLTVVCDIMLGWPAPASEGGDKVEDSSGLSAVTPLRSSCAFCSPALSGSRSAVEGPSRPASTSFSATFRWIFSKLFFSVRTPASLQAQNAVLMTYHELV